MLACPVCKRAVPLAKPPQTSQRGNRDEEEADVSPRQRPADQAAPQAGAYGAPSSAAALQQAPEACPAPAALDGELRNGETAGTAAAGGGDRSSRGAAAPDGYEGSSGDAADGASPQAGSGGGPTLCSVVVVTAPPGGGAGDSVCDHGDDDKGGDLRAACADDGSYRPRARASSSSGKRT